MLRKKHGTYEEFKLLCSEYSSKENMDLMEFAEYGILCHHRGLNRDIRLAIEKLMKTSNPTVIVATMTLGQGVNLGVSTVIIADTQYYDIQKKKNIDLTTNEVWNVIGRGGRAKGAFVKLRSFSRISSISLLPRLISPNPFILVDLLYLNPAGITFTL